MDADGLNKWLTLVANISVVAGIIFLALEVRQNANALKASTYQSMAAEQAQFNQNFMNRDLAEILATIDAGGLDSLLSVQRYQLKGMDNAWLFLQENLYFQYTSGNLPASSWDSRQKAILDVFKGESMQRHWERRGFAFNPQFQRYINEDIIPVATGQAN